MGTDTADQQTEQAAPARHRLFAAVDPAGRIRHAGDVIRLGVSMVVLVALGALAVPRAGFERAVMTIVRALPSSLDGVWRLIADFSAILAVLLVILALGSKRLALAGELASAVLATAAVTAVTARIVLGAWPPAADWFRIAAQLSEFPAARLAVSVAVIHAATPHLIAPLRGIGRWLVGLAALSVVALGSSTPSGAVAALAASAAGVAVTHLAMGSIRHRPTLDDVAAAVRSLGVPVDSLEVAVGQSVGRFVVDAVSEGRPIVVKVYGRDADDTQFLRVVGRTLWFRGPPSSMPIGRVQQVEHEAFLTFFAGHLGVRTHEVVAAGVADSGDAVLVLTIPGQPVSENPSRWNDVVVEAVWRSVSTLHAGGVTHGRLDDHHIVVDPTIEGEVALLDLHGAAVSSSDAQIHADRAQLLVTTAIAVGVDRAVGSARNALGSDELATLLPLLQAPVLTARQRSGLETTDLDLDALRDRVAAEAGCEVPELQKLHRITGRTLVQLALAVVAFMALSSAFSGIDLSLLVTQVREATWWLVVIGLLVAQLARVPAAASTQGASPQPIPLGPLYMLQLALAYIGLALPGSAARFAVNVRFLQRQGLPSGSAVAVSALDSVWWFVVQIVLLVGIIIATPLSLDVDLGGSSGGLVSRLLPIVGLIAVVAIVVLAAVPAWRRPIADWFRQMFHEARAAATGLSQPRRLGGLIGGNLALQILLALALAAFTRALGHPIGYVEVLFVNLSVSLLAGLLPVPGGIGLVEGALTVGLVRAGMPDESAFAAALLYRMATFYLPPIWGFFALRWLERRRFL